MGEGRESGVSPSGGGVCYKSRGLNSNYLLVSEERRERERREREHFFVILSMLVYWVLVEKCAALQKEIGNHRSQK